jgi:hypothetical protein
MKKNPILIYLSLISPFAYSQWTWQNPLPQGNTLNSVYFPDTNTGYAVGDYGTIVKSGDGGATWTKLLSGTTHFFTSVYFTDANSGYVVGEGETILKTTNGGTFVEETISPEQTYILYPNPANDKVTILDKKKLPGEITISIFNITGNLVMHYEIGDLNEVEIDVSTLAKGIYLVKIQTRRVIKCKKLVVN